MYWLTSKKLKISLDNKLLIYKTIIKSIWTYGIEMWCMAAKSHIVKLEALQYPQIRVINTQWYVRIDEIWKDLKIKTDEITNRYDRYKKRIDNHSNEQKKKNNM